MAAHGVPVWGDTKYGTSRTGKNLGKQNKGKQNSKQGGKKKIEGISEIGLYSSRMEFTHPITGEEITLHREPEGKAFEIMDQMDW